MKPVLDKNKYLQIARSQGVSAALTALHHEMEELEFDSFEGQEGWQPEMWEAIKEYRRFSLDLWNLRDGSELLPKTPS